MTIQNMVAEIPKLSFDERLILLEAITRLLRESVARTVPNPGSVVDRLFGAFKTSGPMLSDAELNQIRFDSMMEQRQ